MFKIKLLVAMVLLVFVPLAQAKDVSAQQAGYNNALQRMEKAEEEYKADAQAVADTEKVIEKKRKQLAEEQKKADLSRKNYQEAREKLEQAQNILDKAWKQ
jgi:ABC-type multidrug transport system fused ATPase/permease subunit